ncbi:MAG TPA: hypothetical protein VHW74_18780, partial [Mycobacteriales bacterium]|nr:hypothetical protein [Mycobacteriales bacterium]
MSITEQRTDPAVAPAVDLTDAGLGLRVLQRVVMPMADDMDVLPLYVETDLDRGSNLAVLDASDFKEEEKKKKTQSSSVVNA